MAARRMHPVRLAFSPPAVGRIERVALLLAASWLAWVVLEAWQLHRDLQAAREALAHSTVPEASAARPPRPIPAAAGADGTAAARWNQALRPLNIPWSALLESLERLTPSNVALISIEPDGTRVRLLAEAPTLDALLAYAAALRSAPGFGNVVLVHHETFMQDPQRPVRLALDVVLHHTPVQRAPAPSAAVAGRDAR